MFSNTPDRSVPGQLVKKREKRNSIAGLNRSDQPLTPLNWKLKMLSLSSKPLWKQQTLKTNPLAQVRLDPSKLRSQLCSFFFFYHSNSSSRFNLTPKDKKCIKIYSDELKQTRSAFLRWITVSRDQRCYNYGICRYRTKGLGYLTDRSD